MWGATQVYTGPLCLNYGSGDGYMIYSSIGVLLSVVLEVHIGPTYDHMDYSPDGSLYEVFLFFRLWRGSCQTRRIICGGVVGEAFLDGQVGESIY
jgi:hypothetical protein